MLHQGRFSAGRFEAGQFTSGRFGTSSQIVDGPALFDPVSLFSAGEKGVMYDFGAEPMGAVLASVADLSPNRNDLVQATAARRPAVAGIPDDVGPILNADPRFASGSAWTLGSGWTIADGVASKVAGTASGLSQAVTLSAGTQYAVHINATRSAGNLNTQLTGGATVKGYVFNESRTHTDMLVSVAGNTTFSVWADANFAGTVSSVTIREVTSHSFQGAFFDGIDNWLQAPSVDLSGSQSMTIAVSMYRDDKHGNLAALDVGGFNGYAVAGSSRLLNRGRLDIRDSAGTSSQRGETTPSASKDSRLAVELYEVDFAAATVAEQVTVQQRGVDTSGVQSGALRSVDDLPVGRVTVGAGANGSLDWRGIIHRMAVINRHLTPGEKADLTRWVSGAALKGALIGDSTVAYNSAAAGQPSEAWTVAAMISGVEFGGADVSAPGDKIGDQKALWQGIADTSALDLVMLQIGQNDCNTYALQKTSAEIVADLQDLIDTVRGDVAPACKIYVAALTPARGWLGNSSDAAGAYAHWVAVNEAIEGVGANPVTNVDGRITAKTGGRYWGALGDSGDYLLPEYDHNGDQVHPSNEARFLIAQRWRAQLVADGVLS